MCIILDMVVKKDESWVESEGVSCVDYWCKNILSEGVVKVKFLYFKLVYEGRGGR